MKRVILRALYSRFWLTILIIAAVLFVSRVLQIGHGLPDVQITDETSDISTTARLLQGELPPTTMRYSRTIISNYELIGYAGIYVVNALRTGNFSPASLKELYFAHREIFVYVSRLLVVLLTVLTLFVLADLMRRTISPSAGIFAALLMTTFYFWDIHSILAVPDALIPCALILLLWSSIAILEKGTRWSYLLAGVMLAFVVLAKISAALAVISIMLAHLFRVYNTRAAGQFWKSLLWTDRILLSVAAFIVGNLVMNPFGFIHPADLVTEIGALAGFGFGRTTGAGPGILSDPISAIASRTSVFLVSYLGIVLAVLMVAGIVVAVLQHKQGQVILVGVGILVWLVISSQTGIFFEGRPYYWMPVVPFAIILAAIALAFLLDQAHTKNRYWYYAAITMTAAVILNEAVVTLKVIELTLQPTTFEQAQAFIYATMPRDTAIVMNNPDAWSVPLERNAQSIERAEAAGAPVLQRWSWWLQQPSQNRSYEYDIYGPEMRHMFHSVEDFRRFLIDQHIPYVIETELCTGTENRPDADSPLEFPPLDQTFRRQARLVKIFSPFGDGVECQRPIYDRTTITTRDDVGYLTRLGFMLRVYAVDPARLTGAQPTP